MTCAPWGCGEGSRQVTASLHSKQIAAQWSADGRDKGLHAVPCLPEVHRRTGCTGQHGAFMSSTAPAAHCGSCRDITPSSMVRSFGRHRQLRT
jgi:hypothetical protein